jgi:hypothetical protein
LLCDATTELDDSERARRLDWAEKELILTCKAELTLPALKAEFEDIEMALAEENAAAEDELEIDAEFGALAMTLEALAWQKISYGAIYKLSDSQQTLLMLEMH